MFPRQSSWNCPTRLRSDPIVPQNESIAHRAGQLLARADVTAGGASGMDKVDSMVAAVADRYDEPVLTDNAADFEALGVDIEAY